MVELLMNFTLTKQEAIIYLALIARGRMTGYEVAKHTGISRSNAYNSLASLVDKGGACIIEDTVVTYVPVSVEEFCSNKIEKLERLKVKILQNMPVKKEDFSGYITIKGRENILDKMRNMIDAAQLRIYLSGSTEITGSVFSRLERAVKRGIKVVLISDEKINLEGSMLYINKKKSDQIRLITDSKNVLTGDLEAGEDSVCLYSDKRNLVDLLKESLTNEIKLIEMMKGTVEK